MLTKRQAIRNVTRGDTSLPNPEIKRQVKALYGFTIGTNEISAVLGRYADRRFSGKAGQTELQLAAEFLRRIGGDIKRAVSILHLCNSNEAGEDQAC